MSQPPSESSQPSPDYLRLLYEQTQVMRSEARDHEAKSDRRHEEITRHLAAIDARLEAGSVRIHELEREQAACEAKHEHHDTHHRELEGRALAWALGLIGTLVLFILSLVAAGKLF